MRAVTPGAASLLADAARRSTVITALLDELEGTDVVVYLSDATSGAAGEPSAYLTFVTSSAGIRYVLVRIASWGSAYPDRIAWLGHELAHALEIARAPDVRDAPGVRRLYTHLGWEGPAGRFETAAAIAAGDRVRIELSGRGHVTSSR